MMMMMMTNQYVFCLLLAFLLLLALLTPTLKMEEVCSPKIPINFYQITWRHTPEKTESSL
jgi:energy-converting hydrogenase Eha subunit F